MEAFHFNALRDVKTNFKLVLNSRQTVKNFVQFSLWATCCLFGHRLIAQTPSDSITTLHPVQVTAPVWQKYAAGTKSQVFDSLTQVLNSASSLANLLATQTPIYIKAYGNGMLSSIAFRGTSANHTALLWNGMNINSPSLGGADFSLFPVFALERIELQYGGAASLFGTDAIGGSILLQTQPLVRASGLGIGLSQEVGSFGQISSGIRFSYGSRKWVLQTKLYRQSAQNDFTFRNMTQAGQPLERQTNAAWLNYGVLQHLSLKTSPTATLQADVWYHFSDRQIQPTMSAANTGDRQIDHSLRAVADYTDNAAWGRLQIKAGWTSDYLRFNAFAPSNIHRFFGSASYEKEIRSNITLQVGANWNHFFANMPNYGGAVFQDRSDVFASLAWQVRPAWRLSVNMRQVFVTGFQAPIAPSLGSEWWVVKRKAHGLALKAMLSKNYRIPTLNDRFWSPGGNPNILPEDSYAAELGWLYQWQTTQSKLQVELTTFAMQVQNWIIWLPNGSFWSPLNISNVFSGGVEASLRWQYQSGAWRWSLHGHYTFSQSVNQTNITPSDRSAGKQLPYTPLHRGTLGQTISFKTWDWGITYHYTGFRFTTTDNDNWLPQFDLFDSWISKKWQTPAGDIALSAQVFNLFDLDYQNLEFRAMPKRSFMLGLRYTFH
ncbi:MAG TPA: hypothetical protein DCM08_04995, partial [Microscillaceae bacterium]|nr:hypothetical protein [Microscillaceae bacterium]